MIDYGIDINKEIVCFPNTMYVTNLEVGERKLSSGIILPEETMDWRGTFIRPRWAKVLFKADNITDVNIGDYVLMLYGRWSTSILATINGVEQKIWYISPKSYKKGLVAVSRTMPERLKEYVNLYI